MILKITANSRIFLFNIKINNLRICGKKIVVNTLNDLHKISGSFSNTEKMPVLFLGHGSPLNAIEENQF